jgi:DNA-binding MarR family transcriptional regulator
LAGDCNACTAKAIGQHSHMHKTKVSRAVLDLENKQLVQRLANPADRREAFISLTPKGIDVYEQIIPLAEAYETKLLETLDDADQKTLDRLLKLLTEKAQRF